jgi:gliding motility-associated-like protein
MKKITILFLLILTCSFYSRASHIAGADLTYRWVGGNDWEITLTLYRDCYGIDVSNPETVHFHSSCAADFTAYVNEISGTGNEITNACPSNPTTCSGGSAYGVQEYVYRTTVTLQPCADWTIYWCSCCRNAAITTVSSPDMDGVFVMATLNNTAAATQGGNPNSSPSFSNKPNSILCLNQQYCYNHGAIDLDGDSLVYSLIAPYDEGPSQFSSSCSGGGGASVVYMSPWTYQQPLTSSPAVSIDPVTGDICMLPTAQLITVMAVQVQEYRRVSPNPPVLVGTVIRDMQVRVLTCTNTLPSLPGIDTLATGYNPNDTVYTYAMCLGDSIKFDLYANDPDNNPPYNNLTLTYNNGIPTGSWSVTAQGTPNAVGHFNWTPTSADVSNIPHCFTVQVSDAACPYFGSQAYSYCITVKGLQVNLGQDSLLCKGESYTINASVDTSAVNFHWTVNGTPVTPTNDTTYTFNSNNWPAGSYTVSLVADDGSGTVCPGADHIQITVVQTPSPNLGNDTTLCSGQSVTLDAGTGTTYLWLPLLQATQTITVNTAGQYIALVDGGNNTRCKDSDTVNVYIVPMPNVNLGPDTCVAAGIMLDAGNAGYGYDYLWNINNDTTQTISAPITGDYAVTVTYPNSPCIDKDTIHVKIIPDPAFDLGPDTTICAHQTVTLTGPTDAPYTYLWMPGGFTTSSITTNGPGVHLLQVTGCKTVTDSMYLTLKLCELTVPNVITPNGDSHNDAFVVTNLEYYPDSKITIFNRWGNKIYESNNYQNDWKGENHHDGVYYYILIANDNSPAGIEYHGTITVIGSDQ